MAYSAQQARDFIQHIAPIIQKTAKERGYAICSTTIAQAVIEGAAGTSALAKTYHNHFGLKCGSAWKGRSVNMKTKEEYQVGIHVTIKDNFRAYANDEEGVRGYYDFISTKRYANLKQAKDYRQFADYLKKDGYATSSTYVNTLVKTVEKWQLYQYDQTIPSTTKPTLHKGDKGESVELLQELLILHNYPVKVDGIFGDVTDDAVRKFQLSKALPIDGIVGPRTWSSLTEST